MKHSEIRFDNIPDRRQNIFGCQVSVYAQIFGLLLSMIIELEFSY